MSRYSILMLLFLYARTLVAQEVSPEVSQNFPVAVISKVYEYNRYGSVSAAEQIILASLINKKDSIATAMLLSGKQRSEIDSFTHAIDQQIFNLKGVKIYVDSTSIKAARSLSLNEVEYIQQRYLPDYPLYRELYNNYFQKYRQIFQKNALGSFSGDDSFYQKQNFINASIAKIIETKQGVLLLSKFYQSNDEIKLLPDSIKRKINERFLRLNSTNNSSMQDNLETALHTFVVDTAIYAQLFKNRIQSQSQIAARSELKQFIKLRPTKECYDEITRLLNQKHYQLSLLDVAYANFPSKKDNFQLAVSSKYDSLIQVALLKDGVFINSSLFASAIRMRKSLKLSQVQIDSLIDRGMYLNHVKDSIWRENPLYSYDSKDYENYYLSTILTENQLASLLMLKYWDAAKVNAENDWKDLEDRGLTKQLNKEKIIQELTSYYARLKSSTTMYAYDLNKQSAYIRTVKDNMPEVLKTLQYARKNNIRIDNQVKASQ